MLVIGILGLVYEIELFDLIVSRYSLTLPAFWSILLLYLVFVTLVIASVDEQLLLGRKLT